MRHGARQSDEDGRVRLRHAPRHEPAPHGLPLHDDRRREGAQVSLGHPVAAHGDLAGPVHRVRAEGLLLHDASRSDAASAPGVGGFVRSAAPRSDARGRSIPARNLRRRGCPASSVPSMERARRATSRSSTSRPDRATWRLRAGAKEPDAKTGAVPLRELTGDAAHRVLLLRRHGRVGREAPFRRARDRRQASVMPIGGLDTRSSDAEAPSPRRVNADGSLAITLRRATEATALIGAHVDAAEVPLLADGASLLTSDRGGSPSSRAPRWASRPTAACFSRVAVWSRATRRSPRRSCRAGLHARVLSRSTAGSQRGRRNVFDRAGTATPSPARATHLMRRRSSRIAAPMKPRAFRFDAKETVAQAVPHK